MEKAKPGIDYHEDGDTVGAPLLITLLLTAFVAPVALLAYLLLAVLR